MTNAWRRVRRDGARRFHRNRPTVNRLHMKPLNFAVPRRFHRNRPAVNRLHDVARPLYGVTPVFIKNGVEVLGTEATAAVTMEPLGMVLVLR